MPSFREAVLGFRRRDPAQAGVRTQKLDDQRRRRAEEPDKDEKDDPKAADGAMCPECGSPMSGGKCTSDDCGYTDKSMADGDKKDGEDGDGGGDDKGGSEPASSHTHRSQETTMPIDTKAAPPAAPVGEKAAAATVKELKAAFPRDPAYALECAEHGLSLVEAKAAYADVLQKRLDDAQDRDAKRAQTDRRLGTAGTEGVDPVAAKRSGGGGASGEFATYAQAHAHYTKLAREDKGLKGDDAKFWASGQVARNHRDLFDQMREESQAAYIQREERRKHNPQG